MTLKIFGERVGLKPVLEEVSGKILLPTRVNRMYEIGEVIGVGNGVVGTETKPMLAQVGQTVLFQSNTIMKMNCQFKIEGNLRMLINQGDILAVIEKKPNSSEVFVSEETFKIFGKWVLMEPFDIIMPGGKSEIIIPDTANKQELGSISYRVAQVGGGVDKVVVGDVVVPERNRANMIEVGKTTYFFIHQESIGAVIGS